MNVQLIDNPSSGHVSKRSQSHQRGRHLLHSDHRTHSLSAGCNTGAHVQSQDTVGEEQGIFSQHAGSQKLELGLEFDAFFQFIDRVFRGCQVQDALEHQRLRGHDQGLSQKERNRRRSQPVDAFPNLKISIGPARLQCGGHSINQVWANKRDDPTTLCFTMQIRSFPIIKTLANFPQSLNNFCRRIISLEFMSPDRKIKSKLQLDFYFDFLLVAILACGQLGETWPSPSKGFVSGAETRNLAGSFNSRQISHLARHKNEIKLKAEAKYRLTKEITRHITPGFIRYKDREHRYLPITTNEIPAKIQLRA